MRNTVTDKSCWIGDRRPRNVSRTVSGQTCLRLRLLILLPGFLLSGCDFLGGGADDRPPSITIVSPAVGDTLGGEALILLQGEAFGEDDNYVSFVSVVVNNEKIGEAELAIPGENPVFSFRWNTLDYPDGSHFLEAAAFDRFDGRGISARHDVVLWNTSMGDGSRFEIVSHEDGETVAGLATLIAAPEDGSLPASRVEFLIDGVLHQAISGGPYVCEWNTGDFLEGPHLVQLRAYSNPTAFTYSEPVLLHVSHDPEDEEQTSLKPGRPRFLSTGFSGISTSAVSIGFNDRIYLSSLSDTLYAYSDTGAPVWQYGTGSPVRTSPVIDGNENLFVVSDDGRLHGVGPGGESLWRAFDAGRSLSMPALGVAGDLFFGDGIGNVYRFDTFTGTLFSGYPIRIADDGLQIPPVISSEGAIYFASSDGAVSRLSKEGTIDWSNPDVGIVEVGMALIESSTASQAKQTFENPVLYAATASGNLVRMSGSSGQIEWELALPGSDTGSLPSAPVVGPEGTVYIGTGTGLLAATPEGDLKWRYATEAVGTPVVDSAGRIYFTSGERLLCVNPNNTISWSYPLLGAVRGPLTLRRDGLLILTTDNRTLFAFNTDSDGLARTNWPSFQRNARHTGRQGLDGND